MSADVKLYFWDAEQSSDWPPTEEQVASFPASYSKRYREAKAESVRQQACGSAFLLAMHLGVRSDEQLERGAHGKLMLKNDLRFFCLSHKEPGICNSVPFGIFPGIVNSLFSDLHSI